MSTTNHQYDAIKKMCFHVFSLKMEDYHVAWRVLRLPSITDQIYIKAHRIRFIQSKNTQKIDEGIVPEFIGMVNYAIMGLIQMEMGVADKPDMEPEVAAQKWNHYFDEAQNLMNLKNHDYSEAWREMRISSLTDIILMKLLRIKQIEDNQGKTQISEGIDANFYDIINYSVFALIKLELEGQKL